MHLTLSLERGTHPDLAVRSHRFDEAGGSVGRDPGADWVLPDKRNVVSGRHLLVTFAAGRFGVTDTSRNGTSLNGRPLGASQSRPLSDGDRLKIGDYEFVATIEGAAARPDGSLGLRHNTLIDAQAPSASDSDPLSYIAPAPPHAARSADRPPPPRLVSGGRSGNDDDFAGLFDDTPGQPDTASLIDPAPAPAQAVATVIPLPLPAAPPSPPSPSPPPPSPPSPSPPSPLPSAGPEAEPAHDAALSALPPLAPAPLIPDDWSPDFGALLAPQPAPAGAPIDLATFSLQPLAPPAPIPIRPLAPSPDTTPTPPQDAAQLLQRREAARHAPVAGPAPASPGASEDAELLAVLWNALGVDPGRLSVKDRQRFLGELGLAVREVSDGLIGVLGMRQTIKSEFRMERTMVGSTENNLFKFTRNADELLALAVSNANKVFLPLDRAVRGAFNDIKAHELSTLAAVQLSIRSLLDRFNPAKIEKQVQEKRRGFAFGSLKATCWEHFSEDYGNLAGDADEASNRIFAAELARAYRERTQKQPDA